MKLIIQIALLFGLYYIGTWIQQYFNLFIPGSVIGLILMFILLTTGLLKANWIEKGARFMITHLVLFFIPATVGLLNYYYLFKGKGILLIVITFVSTIIVMISSGKTSQMLAKRRDVSE
ncbi:CidA/LrgA family protein [Pseudogracilibacillus sp. SE30717A]|uniref:CidA/LrgA family protein n=1 Tax=Pseudogracilibacillus sp. SE30717A TaxID=3098293 RepID=UPI00300E5F00